MIDFSMFANGANDRDRLMTVMNASFIVTTFNKPAYLATVLRSIVDNVTNCTEIIIADDGSDSKTCELVLKFDASYEVPIRHCWLPNNGFRTARSRNLAALKAAGDFLVFLDGDCVVTPGWWEQQKSFIESNRIVFGSRLLLSDNQSEALIKGMKSEQIDSLAIGGKFLNIPLGILRSFPRKSWRRFRSFYFSISKAKYVGHGGFDEAYIGWGLEDSDFAVRALRLGIVLFDDRYAGSLLHLHHATIAGVGSNKDKFEQCLNDCSRTISVQSLFNT